MPNSFAAENIFDNAFPPSSVGLLSQWSQDSSWKKFLVVLSHFTGTPLGIRYFRTHRVSLQKIKKEVPRITTGQINMFSSEPYELRSPISARIEVYDEEVLAIMPELEIYGEGASEIEALDDLETEIIELYEYLKSVSQKQLGKSPKKWKKILDSLIIQKSAN